jgi:hypothetical protein
MEESMTMRHKSNNTALVFVGAVLLAGSVTCLVASLIGRSELRRWQAAASIQEPGDLQAVGEGGDVVIVGSLAPDAPAAKEGLALYERWEHVVEYEDGKRESRWRHNYDYDHKPTFDLLVGGHRIRIQNEFVMFYNPREIMPNENVKLKGFAPDDVVTILGSVESTREPLTVEAKYICGGERDRCMRHLSGSSVGPALGAAFLLLVGGGLVGLGVKSWRAGRPTRPSS